MRVSALFCLLALLPLAAWVRPAEISPGPVKLVADLSERRLYLYHNGEQVNSYSIAIGTSDHPTPKGNFRISRIIWNPKWVPPESEWAEDEPRRAPDDPENPMQGAKIFFQYPDYYIHGTIAPGSLGSAASHGCLRMRISDVLRLAEFLQEHAGPSRSADWYERVKRDDSDEHPVNLSRSIPIEIRS